MSSFPRVHLNPLALALALSIPATALPGLAPLAAEQARVQAFDIPPASSVPASTSSPNRPGSTSAAIPA